MKKDISLLIVIVYIVIGCSSKREIIDPIKDLTNDVQETFVIDIVPNENIALKICEIILVERYKNIDFNNYKPFLIKSVNNNSVWHFQAVQKDGKQRNHIYNIKINKNIGEVLNLWVDK